ncbi:hypothetical protein NMG29_06660 [Streptomyces cocklensis]|uniref:HK97 gp10 family phage protein n=1 Tax=Actinacidiphila cocklensis TaxID=887465 RepID=A0A9W4E4P5_9ACTN|nr:hypothetical protein [Actinacidiphila cocklensis]MDD1057913.1 hypothetical protein [Actinacidiphila cocklensis]CAG6392777.1 conserved hypothetical protein [Actinacidiphila cocklensis]
MELKHGRDLTRISRELRKMDDRELLKRFRRELRAAAKPLVPAVRASIRQIPSSRPYTAAGLRGQMARATGLEVKTTGRQAAVIIRVDGRKMPVKAKALQAYMEGTKPKWRHPVFGNRNVYVQQQPHPYFFTVMRTGGTRARLAVNRVIDQVSKDIT